LEEEMALRASDIMTRDVMTVGPDAVVKDIAAALCRRNVSAVPVCGDAGTLLGIVSEGDLMQSFGSARISKRAWWLNLLAEGNDLAPEFVDYIATDHRCARDLMSKPVVTPLEDTPIAELADLMISHSIKRLPIMRAGKVVGVVSRSDIVRTLADPARKLTRSA
jgi:CBS domain-containing protein